MGAGFPRLFGEALGSRHPRRRLDDPAPRVHGGLPLGLPPVRTQRLGRRLQVDLGPDRLVVRSALGLVDPHLADARGDLGADEAVVEAAPVYAAIAVRALVADEGVALVACRHRAVDEAVAVQCDRVVGRVSGHAPVFLAVGRRVEVAHPDRRRRVLGRRRAVLPLVVVLVVAAPGAAVPGRLAVARMEELELGEPLLRADVGEMERDDADRAPGRADHALQGLALHVEGMDRTPVRPDVAARPDDRQARHQHAAELAPFVDQPASVVAVARIRVEARPEDPVMVGQQLGEHGDLVVVVGARPVAFDLLQGDDVGALHHLGDARQVVALVEADAVLDVVAEKLQGGAP